jgi:hypothetical protein
MVSALHPERGPLTSFDRDRMWDVAKSAMPDVPIADAVWLDAYDAYYYSHDGMRPLWDIVVIVLSVGGVAISVTSALPAWRRLVRQGRRVGRASTTLPELVTVHRNEQNREV